ncbi:hypothetical protein TSUD_198160, partial [Trifolium subterraneum]
ALAQPAVTLRSLTGCLSPPDRTGYPPSKFVPSKKPKPHSDDKDKKKTPLTARERRHNAKELTEARKKKRKRHFTLEQDLARLWEKMRRHEIAKDERSKLVTEALTKMKGKIHEIAGSHVTSRVLQTCVKHCSQAERDEVFEELRPHFLTLAYNAYAVHLVKKMLDNASKKQLSGFISDLRGHVAPLLRHMVGSVVVEHAYDLATAAQKQELLLELYSTELQLFKDLVPEKETRLLDVMSKLGLQKGSVSRHMSLVIQPILEKGIVDHSILHRVLLEYFTIADKTSVTDIIQQLSSPLLVRVIGTKDGAKIGTLCVKYGSAKVLVSILSVVDDTKLITKVIIRELQPILKELVFDKNGRRPLLQLLHPNCSRYFSPDELASMNSSIPCLSLKGLLDVCIENVGELIRSNFGKEVVYEVATGGSGDILHPTLDEKINSLHKAIASLAALPKSEDSKEEHVLENFFSSRTIRKLILDCPNFASILWEEALKGKSELWSHGHSCKVISAFLESSDSKVQKLAKKELQPLIDNGTLKMQKSREEATQ